MIIYCPVCKEAVRANEADAHGRCGECRGIADVTFGGVEYAVVGIEMLGGEPAAGSKPSTHRRIARGIREYLRDQSNAPFDPLAPPGIVDLPTLTTRALLEAQGFEIDHDCPAINEHVAKMACNAGGEFTEVTEAFEAVRRQQNPVRWESPPCEHHSKKETK